MTANRSMDYCSNQLGRIILQGMEEVMGEGNVNTILHRVELPGLPGADLPRTTQVVNGVVEDFGFSYQAICGIQTTLEQVYGPLSGRGLALRTGRACFRYGLKAFGVQAGITSLEFRLLPPREKVLVGARALAQAFNRLCDQWVRVEEDIRSYRWIVERCPLCWGSRAGTPVCHLGVGFLQEYLSWASGGKFYHVVETECAAAGAPACVFSIDKQALD